VVESMTSRARPPSSVVASKKVQPSISLPSLKVASSSGGHLRNGPPALQWLPPSRLGLPQLDAAAVKSAEDMVMASWLSEFAGGQQHAHFGSGVLFIELQLRQALAATAAAGGMPDAFRTACVCECLSRLPEAAGGFGNVLGLLRQEVLRAVYVDYEQLAQSGRPTDAQQLLARPTYFTECEKLRAKVAALEERLSDWQRAKEELAQDSDGRAELLRLAATRWNNVLGMVNTKTAEHEDEARPAVLLEASRKLSALLDSMQQHSRAIDELQRLSLLDPAARVHANVSALGPSTRRRTMAGLLLAHGGPMLAAQSEDERVEALHALLVALTAPERQSLLMSAILAEELVGPSAEMLAIAMDALSPADAGKLLHLQLCSRAARIKNAAAARRALANDVREALEATGTLIATAEVVVQAGAHGASLAKFAHAATQTEAKPTRRTHNERADMLAMVAAEVGPEATGVLYRALDHLDAEEAVRPLMGPR